MPGFTVFSVMSADPARPAGAKGVPGGTAAAVPAAVLQGVQQRAKPARLKQHAGVPAVLCSRGIHAEPAAQPCLHHRKMA